jgi:hypothetical protein
VVIKADRSDKTEIKKFFLKISGHQQRWPRPLPGALLMPPALLVVADWAGAVKMMESWNVGMLFSFNGFPKRG